MSLRVKDPAMSHSPSTSYGLVFHEYKALCLRGEIYPDRLRDNDGPDITVLSAFFSVAITLCFSCKKHFSQVHARH